MIVSSPISVSDSYVSPEARFEGGSFCRILRML